MYAGEIKEGEGYDCLKKCIHVSILAYDHFRDDKECYRRIAFCDTKTGKEYTDLIEENIVKLQEKKMALADQIIGGEEMGSGSFSKEELLELLKEL